MDKHLLKAEKKVTFLIGIVMKLIKYIAKANDELEKGIKKINSEIDNTSAHIYEMHDKIDRLAEKALEHEEALQRNAKLISKLDDFLN